MNFFVSSFVIFSLKSVLVSGNENLELSNKLHIAQIKEWWTKVSEIKPIKLNKVDFDFKVTNKDIYEHFKDPPSLKSTKCGSGESGASFKIRGNQLKVVDGVLQGTGKLIFLQNNKVIVEDKKHDGHNTCIQPVVFNNPKVTEVIGTFLDGLLEGQAKIRFTENVTSIGTFKHGYPHGLWRFWNKDEQLERVNLMYNGKEVGKCWLSDSKFLTFTDCSHFDRNETDYLALILELEQNSETVFSGKKLRGNNVIDNLHIPKIHSVSSLNNENILLVNFSPQIKLNKMMVKSKTGMVLMDQEFDVKTSFCSRVLNNSSLTLTSALREFFSRILDSNLNTGHFYQSFAPVTEKLDKEKSLVLLPEIHLGVNFSREINISVLNGPELTYYIISGDFDIKQRCHGLCTIEISKNYMNRTDLGSDLTLGWKPVSFRGDFKHGLLNGPCILQVQGGRIIYGFSVDGVLHGPLMVFGIGPILPLRKNPTSLNHLPGVGFLGNYINGKAAGYFWIGMAGDGLLHGVLDKKDSSVTGNKIAYIYDDKVTVLYGKFVNKIMVSGRESSVQKLECSQNGMMIISKYEAPSGPEFYYEPPSNVSLGSGPPGVLDPFDRKWVELRDSSVPHGGQGVFIRRDAEKNRLVALFSGYFYDYPEEREYYDNACVNNISLSDDHRRACKKYSLGLTSYETLIDYPPETDNPDHFQPTMAQKINHDFLKNNTQFEELEHPRWGMIMCARSTRALKSGEELFGYYGYKESDFPYDFPWYFEEKLKVDKMLRLNRKNIKKIKKKK